jgi:hypothetical protein
VRDLKHAHGPDARAFHRAVLATLRHGDPDHLDVVATPTAVLCSDVTVAPVFNQGHYLAARSSRSSEQRTTVDAVDIVVVDDHSTDGSLEAAHRLLASTPDAITVVTRANGGCPSPATPASPTPEGATCSRRRRQPVVPERSSPCRDTSTRRPTTWSPRTGCSNVRRDRGAGPHQPPAVGSDLLVLGAFIGTMAMFRDAWLDLGGYADAGASTAGRTTTCGFVSPNRVGEHRHVDRRPLP